MKQTHWRMIFHFWNQMYRKILKLLRDSSAGPVVKELTLPPQGAQVPSLRFWELSSHKPHSMAKNKIKTVYPCTQWKESAAKTHSTLGEKWNYIPVVMRKMTRLPNGETSGLWGLDLFISDWAKSGKEDMEENKSRLRKLYNFFSNRNLFWVLHMPYLELIYFVISVFRKPEPFHSSSVPKGSHFTLGFPQEQGW